ncbi:MAG: hypothetical protein KF802_11625 [Bdellovibrionaceae bacterium]|nr:hypothetical protein [Pseudobdellovibrionaceae bacterium]
MNAFILNILLLNLTHNAFSFMLPLLSPEVRAWWKESRHFGLSTNKIVLFLFVFLCGFAFFLESIKHWTQYKREAYIALAITSVAWNLKHILGQIYGLSLIYDKKMRDLHGPPDTKTLALQAAQKKAFHLFFIVLLTKFMLSVVLPPGAVLNLLMDGITLCAVALFCLHMILALAEPRSSNSNKALFLLRLGPFCFFGFNNPWVLYSNFILHSFEHAFLCYFMLKRSYQNERLKPGPARTRRHWGPALFILMTVILLAQTRFFIFGDQMIKMFPNQMAWIVFFGCVSLAFSQTHFFLDEIMFKMRHEPVRRHIEPLILPSGPKP